MAVGMSGMRHSGRALRAASVLFLAAGAAALIPEAGAGASTPTSVTFSPTGGEQTFTVPPGVTSLSVVATGAGGGSGQGVAGGAGGLGAQVTATLSVTPGETLYVEVGGTGAAGSQSGGSGGFNGGGDSPTGGGGGGGASDIRTCSITATTCGNGVTSSLTSRLVVAAGGGGGGGFSTAAGGAGGAAGSDGSDGSVGSGLGTTPAGGGGVGTSSAGGAAGGIGGGAAAGGTGGGGGGGGSPGFGGGGGAGGGTGGGGGGGGGGYYGGGGGGGGGGNAGGGGGGGGGSSYGPTGFTFGSTTATASVVISYVAQVAPTITSKDTTTFTVGQAGAFPVIATGVPTPTFSLSGSVPTWLSIDSTTGALSGTPPVGSGGTDTFTVTAANGVTPDATQSFTLVVDEAPAITSADATTFRAGDAGSFQVHSLGYPTSTFTETGVLPKGVTLSSSGLLAGTPAKGTAGTYGIVLTAANGVLPDATQAFTLTVLREVRPLPVTPTTPVTSTTPPPAPAPAHTTAATGSLAATGIDLVGLIGAAVVLLGGGAALWLVSSDRRGKLHLKRH